MALGDQMRINGIAALAALVSTGVAAPAMAGEAWVGAYAHDITFVGETLGLGAAGKEDGTNFHIGYRTDRLDSFPDWMGGPRAHVFASINSGDDTSYVAAGLNWHVPLGDSGRFYLQPGFGLAWQDSYDTLPSYSEPGLTQAEIDYRVGLRSTKIEFGSKVLFQPELALGMNLSDRTAVELSYVHLSNGQILAQGKNEGLDELGVRLVYRLGQ